MQILIGGLILNMSPLQTPSTIFIWCRDPPLLTSCCIDVFRPGEVNRRFNILWQQRGEPFGYTNPPPVRSSNSICAFFNSSGWVNKSTRVPAIVRLAQKIIGSMQALWPPSAFITHAGYWYPGSGVLSIGRPTYNLAVGACQVYST